MAREIRIGTSGWNYPHWKNVFYPSHHPKAKWLEFYAGHFDTVEVNATFYRLPKPGTFTAWRERTPPDFLWAVKASKYITHTRRLTDAGEALERLYQAVSFLGGKQGPILFQLPPNLHFNDALCRIFCNALRPSRRHVMEVRNRDWINDNFLSILRDHNIAFCVSDSAGRYPMHEAATADFAYVRLHGSRKLYASEYSEEELQAWAERIRSWKKDAYIYFDNDCEGYAVKNARRLREILQGGVVRPAPGP